MQNKMARGVFGNSIGCGTLTHPPTFVRDQGGSDCLRSDLPTEDPFSLQHHHRLEQTFLRVLTGQQSDFDCLETQTGCGVEEGVIALEIPNDDCLNTDLGEGLGQGCTGNTWTVDNRCRFRAMHWIERYDNSEKN